MNVKVRSVALVKTLLGHDEIDLTLPAGTTVDGLFARLAELGGEKLAPYVAVPEAENAYLPLRVIVNSKDIMALDGRRTVLKDGDEVLVFMPLAGG